MMFYGDRTSFASLYEATPKLLLLDLSGGLNVLPESNDRLRWLTSHQDCEGRFVLVPAGMRVAAPMAELLPLTIPPANVWAMWAPTVDEQDAAESLMLWWAAKGGDETVPELILGDRANLNRALLTRSLDEGRRLARANALLLSDLATLRESWENHVRIPREVEELMENLRLAPLRLVFTSPPPTGEIAVPLRAAAELPRKGGAFVCQRIPMSGRGFAGLDLNIANPGSGDGLLTLELIARDEGIVLATWRVPIEALRPGRLPLRLPRALAQPWRSLELCIAAQGTGTSPRLGSSPAGLLPEYALAPSSDAVPPPMLAMRLWGGLPGSCAGIEGALSGLGISPPDPVVAIDELSIAGVRLTREINASYPCFGYLGDAKVLLRPLPNRVSAAVITLPGISHLGAVSCSIAVDEKRCQTRQLGARLVVMPPGRGPDESERAEAALAASEWVELDHPLEARTLRARLEKPHQGPVDLHLFTRLPKGGAIQHVRMVFQDFEAEIREHTADGMPPLLPCDESEMVLSQ